MDNTVERWRADAEAGRQSQEQLREAQEASRVVAETARVTAEAGRATAVDEVNATVAALTLLLQRMEAVETLRRTLRSGGAPEISQS